MTIWEKYSNSDNFFEVYIWMENDKIWTIRAKPNRDNYLDSPYENPANLKRYYIEISNINYINIEGNYCVAYVGWKPFYYRKDAIEIFKKLVPNKIK